jgi:hypothetical protein
MTVAFPLPEWPHDLLNEGPPEDRSILLRGEATIGATRFVVTALRVDPIRLGPDYRPDVAVGAYRDYHLSTIIDIVSELVGIDDASTVQLEGGQYLLWMLPSERHH